MGTGEKLLQNDGPGGRGGNFGGWGGAVGRRNKSERGADQPTETITGLLCKHSHEKTG